MKDTDHEKILQCLDTQAEEIKRMTSHILQTRDLVAFLIVCNVILFLIATFFVLTKTPVVSWLLPSVLLILAALFLRQSQASAITPKSPPRIEEPYEAARERLTWGIGLGGFFGAIAGGTVDVLSLGLTAGQGTLIGIGVGTAVGGAIGQVIASKRKKNRQKPNISMEPNDADAS